MIVHDDAALARLNLARLRADYRELRDRPSNEDQLNSELDACYDEIFHVVPEALPLVEKIKLLRAHIAKLQDALAEACDDDTSRERFIELRALAAGEVPLDTIVVTVPKHDDLAQLVIDELVAKATP